jgi:hypothetical protein
LKSHTMHVEEQPPLSRSERVCMYRSGNGGLQPEEKTFNLVAALTG